MITNIDGQKIHYIDGVPTIITSRVPRGGVVKGFIIRDDFEKDPCFVARVGNSFAHAKKSRDAVREATDKDVQARPVGERLDMFLARYPEHTSMVHNRVLYQWHTILTGSCTMGKDHFVAARGIDLDGSSTVQEFIDATKDSYGSEVILQLEASYKPETDNS